MVALAGFGFYLWSGRERLVMPVVNPGKPAATPVAITVIHRYEPAAATSAAAGLVPTASVEPIEPTTVTSALEHLQRVFDASAPDPTTEQRNDAVLHTMLQRLGHNQLPIESFRCRGSACQMRVAFQSRDQLLGTLNLLPEQEEWKQANLGFNAVPDDPADPNCLRFSVFFTSPPSGS